MDEQLVRRLTVGCRILAEQDILDAYGHLSARLPDQPDRFLISRRMSPALVEPGDFLVMDLEGHVVEGDGAPNAEWPIHGRVYRARPDVGSVLHSHSKYSRIFSLSPRKLRFVVQSIAPEWIEVPVYRRPGLVSSAAAGDAVAAVLGAGRMALLRGHGDVVAERSVVLAVLQGIALRQNAEVLHGVLALGGDPDYWTRDECVTPPSELAASVAAAEAAAGRAWEYYEARVTGRLAELLRAAAELR